MPVTRRRFLSLAALAGVGVACSSGGPAPTGLGPARTGTFDDILAGRAQTLQVVPPLYEFLPGRDEWVTIALLSNPGNEPIRDGGEARVWFAKQRQTDAIGPFNLRALEDGFGARGIYGTTLRLEQDGIWLLLVEAFTGGETKIGISQTQVGQRPGVEMPRPGDAAIVTKTPTVKKPRGVDPICTRQPACSMHGISLDDALANGKPTVMIIGTPAFCQSQFCGPEVDIVEAVSKKTQGVNFIHLEVLRDDETDTVLAYGGQRPEGYDGSPLAPAVVDWKLSEEPAIYFIEPDGTVADRLLGAIDGVETQRATDALLG